MVVRLLDVSKRFRVLCDMEVVKLCEVRKSLVPPLLVSVLVSPLLALLVLLTAPDAVIPRLDAVMAPMLRDWGMENR